MRLWHKFFTLCALLFGLNSVSAAPELATGSLQIQHAEARASIPGQMNSAAYFLIKNDGELPHALVEVSSPAAKSVQLHESVVHHGVASMHPVKQIDVAPHGVVALKPGSYHVMLMGLKSPLNIGDLMPLSLTFEDGSEMFLELPVRHIS